MCCACNLGGSVILGKILICILEGLLLWETWKWGFFEREGSDRLLRGVSFPCEAAVEGMAGFTITTVFVLFRNPRKPYFIPGLPDTPIAPQTPGAGGQIALQKCQRFCLNSCSSHMQKGVEVVLLDQEKTSVSDPWELQSAEVSAALAIHSWMWQGER